MSRGRHALARSFALLALLCVAGPVAAEEQDYARTGPYLGANLLGGYYVAIDNETEDALEALGYSVDVETEFALGFDAYVGYRVHRHVALEAEFEMFPEAEIDVSDAGTVAKLESWSATGNVRLFAVSATGRFQPNLVAGFGAMRAELEDELGLEIRESETGLALRLGGAADFYLTHCIVLRASLDYVLPFGDLEELDYLSFGGGLQFRF